MLKRPVQTFAALTGGLVVLIGCASSSGPVDPAAVQAQFAATKIDLRELAASTIADPQHAAEFVALLNERDALVATQVDSIRRYRDAMRTLNADYDATREDFEILITGYNRSRRSVQSQFVDITNRMKGATTPEEWKTLATFELKELNPREMVYVSEGA